MDSKIQELTEKLYNEGVEKGREEAVNIVENARKEKEALLKAAHAKSEDILAEAQKGAAAMKKNTESELRLYASQMLNSLRSEVTNLISGKIVNASVKTAFDDKEFMQKMILKLISEWPRNERLVIETVDAEALTKYFETQAKETLSKGLEIKQVNGIPTSFSIAPANGSYKVNFGEKEFIEYLKNFLRPQLIELLF